MADKKPEAKKPSGAKPASSGDMFELEIKIFLVVCFVVIIYFATGRRVLENLGYQQSDAADYFTGIINQGFDIFNSLFNAVIFFSVFLILIFVLGSFYLKFKHKEIVTLYKIGLPKGYVASASSTGAGSIVSTDAGLTTEPGTSSADSSGKPVLNASGDNKKWEEIQKHMASMNSSDWRMAILEADILLYDMLDQMGYDGDTIAEKLKMIESSDFNTLDLAWRAHKVRNAISHEGASYEMSHEQAQNTIDLYKKVFEEFYFI